MKKKLTTLLAGILFISFSSFSQSSEFVFKTEGDMEILKHSSSRDGNIFIVKGKNVMSAKNQNKRLYRYNSDFEKIYETDLKTEEKGINMASLSLFAYDNELNITDNGNYLHLTTYLNQAPTGVWLIDEHGKVNDYIFDERTGDVNEKFNIFSNNHMSYLGPKEGRKNYKKKYNQDDIFIFSRKNEDLSTSENVLQLASVGSATGEGSISWYLGEIFNNHFNFMSNIDIDEKKTKNTYIISTNKYNGELKTKTLLSVELEKGHFILSRRNTGPTVDNNFVDLATGNICTDRATGNIYVSGFYTDKPTKRMLSGKYTGFYIFKFDPNGSLIWKKQFSLENQTISEKSLKSHLVEGIFNIINEDKATFVITDSAYLNTQIVFKLDLNSGEVLNTSLADFKFKMATRGFGTAKKLVHTYKNKKLFPDMLFSFNAVTSLHLNKSINDYFSKLNPTEKIYIDANILEDGSIIISYYAVNSKKLTYLNNSITFLKFIE